MKNRRKKTNDDNGYRDYSQAEKKINLLALLVDYHIRCNADTDDRVRRDEMIQELEDKLNLYRVAVVMLIYALAVMIAGCI